MVKVNFFCLKSGCPSIRISEFHCNCSTKSNRLIIVKIADLLKETFHCVKRSSFCLQVFVNCWAARHLTNVSRGDIVVFNSPVGKLGR